MNEHSSGPWMAHGPAKPSLDAPEGGDWCIQDGGTNVIAETFYRVHEGVGGTRPAEANARLFAAAPDLLAACKNARDIIATDRQAFVDCQQLRDGRVDDAIAHGLVWVSEGVWIDADDAEALRDYDRALKLIDEAVAAATGGAQ